VVEPEGVRPDDDLEQREREPNPITGVRFKKRMPYRANTSIRGARSGRSTWNTNT
jgi:hypothetical protein